MAKYDEASIRALNYPENCRTSPAMYIGTTDSDGITHCFREMFDNATDEVKEAKGKRVHVIACKRFIYVRDDGRGIPVGPSKDIKGQSTLTTIFTHLHAGGKTVDTGAYESARGCFTGDTKIKLLDGTSKRIDELANEYLTDSKEQWVFAFNKKMAEKQGLSFVARRAYGVFSTRKVDELAHVTLSNGAIIKCTVDHPFMLWDGSYQQAQNLKENTSLRAVHFTEDKDGYVTHSGAYALRKKPVKQHSKRVHRTVVESLGLDPSNKDVSHKNSIKYDNRPDNLQVLGRKEHWWYDLNNHGKNSDWKNKTKASRKRSAKNMRKVNAAQSKKSIQKARYIQVAARALRDYGEVTQETFDACVGWCYPKFAKAEKTYSLKKLTKLAQEYLDSYGPQGRTDNGGNGLSYRLQSEYKNSPAKNYANHSVKSVKIVKLDKLIQVYGMSVEKDHNYLLDAGVFVKNTHGVGAAVVNAVAEELNVWSKRSGKWYTQSFKKGIATSDVVVRGKPSVAPAPKPAFHKGSAILFRPDPEIFGKAKIDVDKIHEIVKTAAYFQPNVTFTFHDDKEVFNYKTNGLIDFVPAIALEQKAELVSPIFTYERPECSIAFAWSNTPELLSKSYVSGGISENGGTHQKALDDVMFESFQEIGGRAAAKVNKKFLKMGLVSVINISIHHPTFSSQTKSKLTSRKVIPIVKEAKEEILKYFKANKDVVKSLITMCKKLQENELKFRASAEVAAKLKMPRGKLILPPKLAVSSTKNPKERELYIVEGDSAGGSAKVARDPMFQEVLPIRGKFTNPYKEKASKVFANESVLSIFKSIGFNPAIDNPLENLRVGKIMLLSDADEDGYHINALLAALFSKFAPELYKKGKIYVVKAPLFRGVYQDKEYYGSTIKEVEGKAKRKTGLIITRFKGWGESQASELNKIAFDKETRKLLRLKPITQRRRENIEEIMGDSTDTRRRILGLE